jgi:hypothetical protein
VLPLAKPFQPSAQASGRLRRYASQTALDTLAACYESCGALIGEYYAHYYALAKDPQRPPPPLPPALLQDRVARPLGARLIRPRT